MPQIEGDAIESFIVRPSYGDALGSLAAAICAIKEDLKKTDYIL